jgi:hypothetical protein
MFVKYFEDPIMTKIKDIGKYSMYMTRNNFSVGIENRYIIAFINKNSLEMKSMCYFNELKWVSLQTRTLPDEHDIKRHSYVPDKNSQLIKKITLSSKNEKAYNYNIEELPLTVTLIPPKPGLNEYKDSGTLISAIETYNTIITWK